MNRHASVQYAFIDTGRFLWQHSVQSRGVILTRNCQRSADTISMTGHTRHIIKQESACVLKLVQAGRQPCSVLSNLSFFIPQDPMNPNETVIVIRSLVPGGVAQQDGRLVPGDRLMFVNSINLEQATLDEAAQALKGAAKGTVHIGVAKPLPLSETPFRDETQVCRHRGY